MKLNRNLNFPHLPPTHPRISPSRRNLLLTGNEFAFNISIMEKTGKKETTIGQEIVTMLISQLNKKPEDVKPKMRIKEDLGADSLDVVEILMEIEDKYGIQVPDEVVMSVKTVEDLVNVAEKLSPKK